MWPTSLQPAVPTMTAMAAANAPTLHRIENRGYRVIARLHQADGSAPPLTFLEALEFSREPTCCMRQIGACRARPQRYTKPTAAMGTSIAPPSSMIAATPRLATARPRPSRLAEVMNLFFCSALEVVIDTTGREQVQCHRRPSVSAHASAFSAFDGAVVSSPHSST